MNRVRIGEAELPEDESLSFDNDHDLGSSEIALLAQLKRRLVIG